MRISTHRGKFCVYYRDERGNSIRRSLGTTDRVTAEERFQRFLKTLEEERVAKGYTVQELWDLRQESLKGRRMATSMVFTGKALLPTFGDLSPQGITPELVKEYTQKRYSEGRKPGTVLTELSQLRTTVNWAVKKSLIPSAPHIEVPSRPAPKLDYLTKEQAKTFLKEASHVPHLFLFSILAICLGARSTAILELTWDRVDFEKHQVNLRVQDMDHRKGRPVLPLNDLAFTELKKAKDLATSKYVIEYCGSRVLSVKKGIKSVARRCHLPFVSPHVFRHSAAVWMAEASVPMEEIAQYLAHSNVEITRRVYARFSPEYLQKAAKALNIDGI